MCVFVEDGVVEDLFVFIESIFKCALSPRGEGGDIYWKAAVVADDRGERGKSERGIMGGETKKIGGEKRRGEGDGKTGRAAHASGEAQWTVHYSEKRGRSYLFNSKTGESRWCESGGGRCEEGYVDARAEMMSFLCGSHPLSYMITEQAVTRVATGQ